MRPAGIFTSGQKKGLQTASRYGKPTMTPESESEAGIDILKGGSQARVGGAGTGIVATIVTGSTGATEGTAENVAPATEGNEAKPATAQPDPNAPPLAEHLGPAAPWPA